MKIVSIEPTPSPNTMKINLSKSLEQGARNSYNENNIDDAPPHIKAIFEIEGIRSVYHVADFMAIDRNPRSDWEVLLPQVRAVFGEEVEEGEAEADETDHYGEVNVFIQMYKDIPMQIKLTDGEEEKRKGLPDRFVEAIQTAQEAGGNVVLEREWVEQGVRYGELDEIAEQVADEIAAAYPEKRLQALVAIATGKDTATEKQLASRYIDVTLDMLDHEDWRERFAVLDRMDPKEKDLPVLDKALSDENGSIRRLAAMYLGMIEKESVLPYVYKALKDPSVAVRRTAGDALSDIGSPKAIPAMIEALKDESKIVRWRAAMFLYEVGDETAIEALREAESDPEFEVALQVKMALERIEGGEKAKGSIWRQMTEARKQK